MFYILSNSGKYLSNKWDFVLYTLINMGFLMSGIKNEWVITFAVANFFLNYIGFFVIDRF